MFNSRQLTGKYKAAILGISLSAMLTAYHPMVDAQPDESAAHARPNPRNKAGNLAKLAFAIMNGNGEFAKMVIHDDRTLVNADLGQVIEGANTRITPLMLAIMQLRNSGIPTGLMSGDHQHVSKDAVISVEAVDANLAIANMLVKNGASVNAKDGKGRPMLTLSVMCGNVWMPERLIELGAKVNARDRDGKTAIRHTSDMDLIGLLMKHGADVNVPDNKGRTMLMDFTLRDDVLGAMQFIGKADVKQRDRQHKTALDLAIENGKKGMERFLREHGAR